MIAKRKLAIALLFLPASLEAGEEAKLPDVIAAEKALVWELNSCLFLDGLTSISYMIPPEKVRTLIVNDCKKQLAPHVPGLQGRPLPPSKYYRIYGALHQGLQSIETTDEMAILYRSQRKARARLVDERKREAGNLGRPSE